MPTATRSRARRCYAYGHGDVPSQALHRRARAGRLAGRGAGARGRRGRWRRRDVHRREHPQAVGSVTVAGGGTGVAAAPDGSRLYVAGPASSPPIDPNTRATLGTVALPVASTLAVSPDGARVYAAHKGGITVVDTTKPAPVLGPTITLPGTPQAIAVSSDGTRAVVTQTRGPRGGRRPRRLPGRSPPQADAARGRRVRAALESRVGRLRRHGQGRPRLVGLDTVGLRIVGDDHPRARSRRRQSPSRPTAPHAIVGADANQDHAAVVSFRGRGLASSRARAPARAGAIPPGRRTARASTSADRFSGGRSRSSAASATGA